MEPPPQSTEDEARQGVRLSRTLADVLDLPMHAPRVVFGLLSLYGFIHRAERDTEWKGRLGEQRPVSREGKAVITSKIG